MKKLLIKATTILSAAALLSFCGCTDTSQKMPLGKDTSTVQSSVSSESKTTSEASKIKETSKTTEKSEVSKETKENSLKKTSNTQENSKESEKVSETTESSVEKVESSIEANNEVESSIEESYEEESENYDNYSLYATSYEDDYAAAPDVDFEEEETVICDYSYSYPNYYTANEFYNMGIIEWGGWSWTYYSEVYMPGEDLPIPGRWTDENGYVCDENNYICLASSSLPKGTIVDTPFGKMGKVYDCGCLSYILDVYVSWY